MKTKLLDQIGKVALLMLGIFISAASVVLAQSIAESAVPPNTVKAFKAATQGSAAKWKMGPSKSYEASWAKDGKQMVYVFDQEGKLQQKKYVSSLSSLPSGIPAAVAAACPNGKVDGAYRVISRTNQKFIEVQVSNTQSTDRMRFDLTGKPLGKTSVAVAKPAVAPTPTVQNTVAMRGATPTTLPNEDISIEEEADEDIKDLIEDDSDLGDLLDDGDELLFVHAGRGDLFCDYDHLTDEAGDYILIPRGTMWRL